MQRIHTAANNYRCADPVCPCTWGQQDGPDHAPVPVPVPLLNGSTSCAWCCDELGIPAEQRRGSHGICKRHTDLLIAQSKQRRARRMKGH